MSIRKLIPLSTFLLFLCLNLNAGLIITINSQGEAEVSYFQKNKSAVWIDGNVASVSDADTGLIYQTNHSQQVYTSFTIDSLVENMQNMADEQMAEAKASPFFQQMLDQQQAEAAKHTWNANKTGTQSIAGVEADVFEISKDGEIMKTMWVSKSLNKQINKEFPEQKFKSARQQGEQIMREIIGKDPEWETEAEVESKGIVVYESEKDMFFGEVEVLKELISVEETTIDSARFEIPQSYEEVDFQTFIEMEEASDEEWEEDDDNW